MADAAKCSESFISKLENDKASPSFTMLHRLTAILGANVASLFAIGDEVGNVVSHQGARPVILTDRLRIGKGIKLERLIPYSHSYLLQGNIHHIAPAAVATAISSIPARKSATCWTAKLSSPWTAAGFVPRPEIPFISARSYRMGIGTSAPKRRG